MADIPLIDIEPADDGSSDVSLTSWDRRLIAAIGVVAAARKGALIARVASIVVAAGAIVGVAILAFWTERYSSMYVGSDSGASWEFEWNMHNLGQFLQAVAAPLAFAGIVFAVSYMIEVAAARLDLEIVLADDDTETDSE